MAIKVAKTLNIEASQIKFWSDSFDVLAWIKNRTRVFGAFVRDKIGKIHEASLPDQWNYIPSETNPADLLTHKLSIIDLANCTTWKNGPKFLSEIDLQLKFEPKEKKSYNTVKSFLTNRISGDFLELPAELHPDNLVNKVNSFVFNTLALEPRRFSSWIRYVRIKSWVYRFVQNLKYSVNDKLSKKGGELTQTELLDTKIEIIKETQMSAFCDEYNSLAGGKTIKQNSKILVLSPQLDDTGILRCNGRLQYSDYLPYDVKFPIILPKNSDVTSLIVKHFHDMYDHKGTNFILSKLSAKYWIITAREEIRKCEKKCFECKPRKTKTMIQIMAPLSSKRINKPLRAFINVLTMEVRF